MYNTKDILAIPSAINTPNEVNASGIKICHNQKAITSA